VVTVSAEPRRFGARAGWPGSASHIQSTDTTQCRTGTVSTPPFPEAHNIRADQFVSELLASDNEEEVKAPAPKIALKKSKYADEDASDDDTKVSQHGAYHCKL